MTQEWKQRAMAALDLSNKSKAMAVAWCKLFFLTDLAVEAEFKAEAEAKE